MLQLTSEVLPGPFFVSPHLWVKISRRRWKQKGKKTPAFIYAKAAHNTYPQTWSKHAAHKHIIHAWYSSEYERKQTHQKRPWRRLPNLAPQLLACFYFKEELHLWLHFTHGSLGSIIPWFTAVRIIKCALFNRSGQLKWGSLWSASLFFLCHIYIYFAPTPSGSHPHHNNVFLTWKPQVKTLPAMPHEEKNLK